MRLLQPISTHEAETLLARNRPSNYWNPDSEPFSGQNALPGVAHSEAVQGLLGIAYMLSSDPTSQQVSVETCRRPTGSDGSQRRGSHQGFQTPCEVHRTICRPDRPAELCCQEIRSNKHEK